MKLSPTPRERRALVAGCIAIGGVLLLGRGLPALRHWSRETVESAAQVEEEARQSRSMIQSFPSVAESLAARRSRFLALAPMLLDGSSVNAAGAALAGLVSHAGTNAHASLGPMDVSVDTTTGRTFARISIHGSLTADVRSLTGFLSAVEAGPLLLRVSELRVAAADPVSPPERPEILHVSFVLEGLALNPRLEGER